MKNLILSFNVVAPLCLVMALGYFLKYIKILDKGSVKVMNNTTFKVFLPTLLFYNIYTTDLGSVFDPKLMIFATMSIIILFGVLFLFIPIIEKDNSKRGVMIQGIFRSNFVLFGIPVATSLVGEGKVGTTALLIGVIVPLFNFLAVVCLETFRGGSINIKKIIRGIVTNPLIIGAFLGLLLLILNIKLPLFIVSTIKDISKMATPLSLTLLGASFSFSNIKKYLRETIIVVIGKLIITPLIFILISYYCGFRGVSLLSLMIMFASPTAISSFQMAIQMDGDSDLASQIVVFTSAFSIVTVFCWIFILKELALI
ncbi:AEC family transporter [Terrisporobacter petrolearius]|uniref:AEC family transporter n=1 Tax=Terrisporobacter petrolearius TaxID=1460447 RepID=UPI001D164474|nr:AEC family transporter [Terrisporobacter petrolearius]MCC3866176.1 AEC family transporter [Terrisporobacter petrolearius]